MWGHVREFLFITVVLFANIVEGITGFAGTMLAMPVSMMLVGAREAKVILNIVALMVSGTIVIKTHEHINKKELTRITLFMMAGMAAGLYLYSVLPIPLLSVIYGALIILVAVRGIVNKKQKKLSRGILIMILLAAGVIHGLFLSGGALLVVYATVVLKEKGVIRATLEPVWLMLNTIILIQDLFFGRITPHVLLLTGLCLPPVVLALLIGNYLHKRIKQEIFVRLTYLLLLVSGISLII